MNLLAALAALSLSFWCTVAMLGSAGVQTEAWLVLYGLCASLSLLALWRRTPSFAPTTWLYLTVCVTLLAAVFLGANVGLDALNGAHRAKPDVAGAIGGLELWLVLFPGVASSTLACAVGTAAAAFRSPNIRTAPSSRLTKSRS